MPISSLMINEYEDGDKFINPNGKKIKELRSKLKRIKNNKSSIEKYFIDTGLYYHKEDKETGKKKKEKTSNVSLRTYYSIEKGERVNIKYLKNVALLFTRLFKDQGEDKNINIKSLILGGKNTDPKSINTYLDKIKSVDQLFGIINLSSTIYKKTFFNCQINESAAIQIDKILNTISNAIKFPTFDNNFNDEKDFYEENKILKTSAQVNDALNKLQKDFNICLYVGVLKEVPVINAKESTQFIEKKGYYDPYDNSDPLRHKVEFEIKSFAEKRNYLVLNFTNCNNGSSIDLNYEVTWSYKEILEFIKKNPYLTKDFKEIFDHDIETGEALPNQDRAISSARVHYEFGKPKLNLPWGLMKNNFHFNSSIDDGKIMFENEEEFLKEAREVVKEEWYQEGQDMMADMRNDDPDF